MTEFGKTSPVLRICGAGWRHVGVMVLRSPMPSLPRTLGGELQGFYWLTFVLVIWILKLLHQSVDDKDEERRRDYMLDGTSKI